MTDGAHSHATDAAIAAETARATTAEGTLLTRITALETQVAADLTGDQLGITAVANRLTIDEARIAKLEGGTVVVPPPTPPPPPPPPPTPTGNLFTLPLGSAPSVLAKAAADPTVGIIEIPGGTWRSPSSDSAAQGWHLELNIDRGSAHPLLIRPVKNGAVIFDGTGDLTGGRTFGVGWGGKCSYITFDAAGTGGSFRIQNQIVHQTGLVATAYVDHFTMNGFTSRGNNGDAVSDGWTEYAVYVSSDGTHRGQYVTFNGWDHDAGTGVMSGFQIEHAPNCDHVVSQNWITKGGHFGCVLRQDATDVQISGYVMSNHVTSFSCQGPTGKVSNMKATNSGAPEIGSGMVDGGGNVWA